MIEVNVTQEHIDDARDSSIPDRSTRNPVARATCEALSVEVGQFSTNVSIGSIKHESGKITTLPDEALEKLRSWYQGTEIKPFSFTVDL